MKPNDTEVATERCWSLCSNEPDSNTAFAIQMRIHLLSVMLPESLVIWKGEGNNDAEMMILARRPCNERTLKRLYPSDHLHFY